MAKVIPMEEWVRVFRDAADECSGMLRFGPAAALPAPSDDSQRPGAYIAILSELNSVHLGLTASPEGCRALARGLLGLHASESLSEKEVADGVSEVMNIVAGKVKSRLNGRDGAFRLGLPLFIAAPITAAAETEISSADVRIGPLDCRLTVYRQKRAA